MLQCESARFVSNLLFVYVLSEYAEEKDFREEFCMRLTPKGGESLFPPPTGVVCNMMPIIVGRHETLPEEFRGSVSNHSVQFRAFHV